MDIRRIAQNYSVVNGDLGIHRRALESVEALLMARLLSFRTIYYHKTSRSVQLMIERAIEDLINSGELDLNSVLSDVEEFLDLDDCSIWSMMKRSSTSAEILKDLSSRRIYKVAYEANGIILSRSELEELKEEILGKLNLKESHVMLDNPNMIFIKDKAIPKIYDGSEVYTPFEVSPVLLRLRDIRMSVLRVYVRSEIKNVVKDRIKSVVNRFIENRSQHEKPYKSPI